MLGQEIRTLVDENQSTGFKTIVWDGKDSFNNLVPSGIYLYKIKAGNFIQIHKMVLLK